MMESRLLSYHVFVSVFSYAFVSLFVSVFSFAFVSVFVFLCFCSVDMFVFLCFCSVLGVCDSGVGSCVCVSVSILGVCDSRGGSCVWRDQHSKHSWKVQNFSPPAHQNVSSLLSQQISSLYHL